MPRSTCPTTSVARVASFTADTPPDWAVARAGAPGGGFVLEATAPGVAGRRVTIFGFDPVDTVTLPAGCRGDPLRVLADRVRWQPVEAVDHAVVPFCGGWVGYIGYECACGSDRIRRRLDPNRLLPDLRFSLYDTVAVFDHASRGWYAAGIDWRGGGPVARPGWSERVARLAGCIAGCPDPGSVAEDAVLCDPPEPNMSAAVYLSKVRRIKEYIAAGDVYQVNLTQRFSAQTSATPVALYRRLNRVNPAPCAAFLRWDDRAVVSASPERFLDLRAGQVETRPIKGTRPRIGDPVVDAAWRAELEGSEKDRAELNMIIDLLRNDLGRVCRFGSVRVLSAGTLEAHPTVYHRVATVVGELAEGRTWVDLLRATFPGGSITGAPKIRAMEIIDELEPTPRDVYCGAIGYVGLDGSMSLSIAIRTMVMRGSEVYFYAGGGIVADSDPQAEYDESLAKAAGMMRALGHDAYCWSRAGGGGADR